MTKRKKFILASIVLSLCLFSLQWVSLDFRFVAVFGFFFIAYATSAWALWEDLKGVEWITILLLPALYATGTGLFYFLLPSGVVAQIMILVLFGLGMYALFLTENIYSVAAIRTIQLLRAANAVGFLMSVVTLVLFYNTIFSVKLHWWLNGVGVALISFPVLLQGLWSVTLKKTLGKNILFMSMGLSIMLGMIGVTLSFLPATVWIASLFLATVVYIVLGLLQHALDQRLFSRTIYEYLSVGVFVIIATLVVMPWK